MTDISGIAAASMQSDQARLRAVAQNLANSQTPGYRAELAAPTLAPRFDALLSQAGVPVPLTAGTRNERPGALQQTNRQLDLAIEGAGYFRLLDGGREVYSRRGDFHIDEQGVLRGARELPVAGTTGEIHLPNADVVIHPDGAIEKDGVAIDHMTIVQFPSDARLDYLGDGLFVTDNSALAVDAESAHVRQGFVEAANVRPMDEMTQLMEITRRFGAAAQALKAYDQMLDSALTGLGSY